MTRDRLALAVTLALALTGCRFGDAPAPGDWGDALRGDPALASARDQEPLPFRVGVAPPRIVDAPAATPTTQTQHRSRPDLTLLHAATTDALHHAGLFAEVVRRGDPGMSSAEVDRLAWSSKDDLLLEVEVTDYRQEFLGHSNYLGWFLAYVTYVWPAWFIPVDHYGVGMTVVARLRSVQRQAEPLLEKEYRIEARDVKQDLTPSDRELAGLLDLGALWDVYSSLEDSNWQAIERAAGPHAWRALLLDLLHDIEVDVTGRLRSGGAERERVVAKLRKRFGIVIGVSEFADASVAGAAFAAEDAEALSALWSSPQGGGLELDQDLLLLVDEQATRGAILAAIAAVSERCAPPDEVLVYYAGLGIAPDTGSTLLTHDASSADWSGTALPLAELLQSLSALRAERVVLLVDASFAQDSGTTRTLPATARRAAPAGDDIDPLRPGLSLLLAARPDQAAHVLPRAKAGLFSAALRHGVSGAADADQDGRTTLAEVVAFVTEAVTRRAGLEGFVQRPVARGVAGPGAELGWPR